MKHNDTIKMLRYLNTYLQSLIREQKLYLKPFGYTESWGRKKATPKIKLARKAKPKRPSPPKSPPASPSTPVS